MTRGFESLSDADVGAGRVGRLHTPEAPQGGAVDTPAFFPVLNLMGGPTPISGGIWSRLRNRLFGDDAFQGAMFQAMSFLDFNLGPDQVNKWRNEADGLHDWFTGHQSPKDNPKPPAFTQPLFVDSGGFKLMNSRTFADPPEEGGDENEWGIYTNPDSILELQYDYGADLLATLDYPIPPDLDDGEKYQRIEDSIDSAVECLRLLNEADKYTDWNPTVYAAIHGHSHEEIAYYVSELRQRTDYPESIDGFAVGSLVPLRSGNVDTLVDIVQGATDAIPDDRRDDLALHVFGVGGHLAPLMAVLGVDSYDSSTYVQAAQHMDFIHPTTSGGSRDIMDFVHPVAWEKISAIELEADEWQCSCPACAELEQIGIQDMKDVLEADRSYQPITLERDGQTRTYMKSDFYAIIAYHNFHMYQREVDAVREAISDGRLGNLISNAAKANDDIATGLARAAARWPDLRDYVPNPREIEANAPDSNPKTFQSQFGPNGEPVVPTRNGTSLAHTPADFDFQNTDYSPNADARVCLILPCSQTKPYRDSRTHRVVRSRLTEAGVWDFVDKVSVSGLYGPVPKRFETNTPIETYDYVLTDADKDQIELVKERLVDFLNTYASEFDEVYGYATSKTYRTTIKSAFEEANTGVILPTDPPARRLTEHFRTEHLDELADRIIHTLDSSVLRDPE